MVSASFLGGRRHHRGVSPDAVYSTNTILLLLLLLQYIKPNAAFLRLSIAPSLLSTVVANGRVPRELFSRQRRDLETDA